MSKKTEKKETQKPAPAQEAVDGAAQEEVRETPAPSAEETLKAELEKERELSAD